MWAADKLSQCPPACPTCYPSTAPPPKQEERQTARNDCQQLHSRSVRCSPTKSLCFCDCTWGSIACHTAHASDDVHGPLSAVERLRECEKIWQHFHEVRWKRPCCLDHWHYPSCAYRILSSKCFDTFLDFRFIAKCGILLMTS